MEKTCVIWRITDGKRGHERQTQGLVQALAQLMPIQVIDLRAESRWRAAWHGLVGNFAASAALDAPDLIVGAGHDTHLTMLAAARACGGKTVVLMKPSLPLGWFDLCLLPEHDAAGDRPNVIKTRGAVNAVKPTRDKDVTAGLILLGGVSAHYHWDEAKVLEQVRNVVARTPAMHWTLTTSPRTPASTLAALRALSLPQLQLVPFQQASEDWLPAQLPRAAQVWVTPDSVSMLYEALTAGAAVGVFELQRTGAGRVASGVDQLLRAGLARGYQDWQGGQPLAAAAEEFNEAARCARWIKQNWFPEN